MSTAGYQRPLLLGVDTATETLALSLSAGSRVVTELTVQTDRTHATVIIDAIGHLLELAKLEPGDIDGLIAGRGPGSFTGLRIGLAVVKGMALALSKPVVAVSSLACLALQAGGEGMPVWAMIDARRKQVYCCSYRLSGYNLDQLNSEQVLSPRQLVDLVSEPCLLVGTGAINYKGLFKKILGNKAVFAPAVQHRIRPASLAQLGWQKWQQGRQIDGHYLVPVYLRRPDARPGSEK